MAENKFPLFGPGGNSDAFRAAGFTSTVNAPMWLRSIDLDAYEYEAGNGISASPSVLSKIGSEARKYGIKMSFHTPYFISLSGVVTETRLKSIEYIRRSIDAAALLGADIIVIHCGSCAKITRDEAMRLSADTLIRTLEEVPLHGIRLGIETMGKKNQLGTLDEVLELCRIDKALVPVVDFGHLRARECGGDFSSADDFLRAFDKIDRLLGSDVVERLHCHFSKIEWTDKGERKHLTFEDELYGPRYEHFAEAIAKNSLAPTVICESAGTQSEDALKMKKYYGDLI